MLFYSFTVGTAKNRQEASFLVWVDHAESGAAESMARGLITERGWVVLTMDGVSETSREDYFAPCPSLDAFVRAEDEGISFRVVSL